MPGQPLIVCIYTPGTPYERDARQLAASAARFGYPVRAIPVADQGDWWRNVGIKPRYVLEALQEHDGPLLALDADCLILEPLDELLALLAKADVSVMYRPIRCFTALFNAAVLALRKTPATLAMVAHWARCGGQHAYLHRFAEQGAFTEAMLLHQNQLRFQPLPEKFHMFPDQEGDPPPAGCAIFHSKLSKGTRATALPANQGPPRRMPPDAQLFSYGPEPSLRQPLPCVNVDGANRDFTEYARRHGITRVGFITLPVAETDWPGLQAQRLTIFRRVLENLPAGSKVVISDFDVIFLHSPRVFADPLTDSDVVIAWDQADEHSLPSTKVLGLRATPAVTQQLLPQAEQMLAQLRSQPASQATPATVLASILRANPRQVALTTLPAETIAPVTDVRPASVAIAAGFPMVYPPVHRPARAFHQAATVRVPLGIVQEK